MVTSSLRVQTDRHGFGILIRKHVGTQKKIQLEAQNKWLAVDPYMPPRRTGMHNWKKDFHHFVELVERNPLMYNINDLG